MLLLLLSTRVLPFLPAASLLLLVALPTSSMPAIDSSRRVVSLAMNLGMKRGRISCHDKLYEHVRQPSSSLN